MNRLTLAIFSWAGAASLMGCLMAAPALKDAAKGGFPSGPEPSLTPKEAAHSAELRAALSSVERAAPAPAPQAAGPSAPESSGRTGAETVDQVLDNMEAARKTLKTFKAEAAKVRRVEALDETEKFTGNIQFKTPRLLRLQLRNVEGGEETIYIVGKTYGWIYRPQKKQAERAKLAGLEEGGKSGNPLEYGLAQDIHNLRKGYTLKLLPPEKIGDADTIPLELTPEGGTSYAAGKLVFWIDRKTWLPVQVREFKSNDEIIETHTFSKIEVNTPVSDGVFEFKPPKGVDEIITDAQ